MDNSAIICDVGRSLGRVLELALKAKKRKASVVLGPPTLATLQRQMPAFGVTLLSVDSLDESGREPEPDLVQETSSDGQIHEYFVDPPLPLTLEYMLTAWAKSPEEEAALLGFGMKALLECPMLEQQHIAGESFTTEDKVSIRCTARVPLERRIQIFQSFGEGPRGAAFYSVAVLLFSERRSKEIRRVLTKHVGYIDDGTGRRFR